MQVDRIIGSKVVSAYYQVVRIGNVEMLMVKGEPVAFQAPGLGCLGSMSNTLATLSVRARAAFQWRLTAEITGGTPFTACLTNALKNAFNTDAELGNETWFDQYKTKYNNHLSYRTL